MKDDMSAIEIARRMAQLGRVEDACRAYAFSLAQGEVTPEDRMEAAIYVLQMGGDYKAAYDGFLALYREGCFREDCFQILTGAFYEPNEKDLRARYAKNCRLLTKYPYLFRKDFLSFEELPVRFYPYDDNGYRPFHVEEERFDAYIDFNTPVVTRNFFADLEKPILAKDVFSQYELEYLNDNVRKSEWVSRENHIYLHYSDWGTFCAHLQVLDWKPLLAEKKIVFLIGEEIAQYPIDFKERFGIDYSQYPLKPLGIREINRLIWHTQLSTHNGGDFFNEVFDAHPNLLYLSSLYLDTFEETIAGVKEDMKSITSLKMAQQAFRNWEDPRLVEEFYRLKDRTDKDILVVIFLSGRWDSATTTLDRGARIAPAIFLQPHFNNIDFGLKIHPDGGLMLSSEQYDQICRTQALRDFKYMKAFTPMRRFTTSCAATVRFAYKQFKNQSWALDMEENPKIVGNVVSNSTLNRSFMRDPNNRLFRDSVVVRFEDGKLNPKATFTALAAFVDLPYTESMTYCSLWGRRDIQASSVVGFDPVTVYRTYDEFLGVSERCFLEYFLRDAYEYYGYDFKYYDGGPVDEARMTEWAMDFGVIFQFIREGLMEAGKFFQLKTKNGEALTPEEIAEVEKAVDEDIQRTKEMAVLTGKILMKELLFVNAEGQPLDFTPVLKLDPALLEQPLYR